MAQERGQERPEVALPGKLPDPGVGCCGTGPTLATCVAWCKQVRCQHRSRDLRHGRMGSFGRGAAHPTRGRLMMRHEPSDLLPPPGLFEAHLSVRDLGRSIAFRDLLRLELARVLPAPRVR